MSLIGLLTATEKQVYLDRLHMRPIQWHLKNNWRVPESLEKVIPIPTSLHSHLEWWLEEDNVLQGQPLHPLKHALQIFTDASKEGWGAHLNEHTATAKGRRGIPSWNLSLVLHQLTKAPFEPLREASLKLLTFKTIFLLARANVEVRFMLGKTGTSGTSLTGQKCPCTLHPASFQRISWPRRAQRAWSQWLSQPWPQLWTSPSNLTGPSAQSELCATIWTGPQTSGRIRS